MIQLLVSKHSKNFKKKMNIMMKMYVKAKKKENQQHQEPPRGEKMIRFFCAQIMLLLTTNPHRFTCIPLAAILQFPHSVFLIRSMSTFFYQNWSERTYTCFGRRKHRNRTWYGMLYGLSALRAFSENDYTSALNGLGRHMYLKL